HALGGFLNHTVQQVLALADPVIHLSRKGLGHQKPSNRKARPMKSTRIFCRQRQLTICPAEAPKLESPGNIIRDPSGRTNGASVPETVAPSMAAWSGRVLESPD